MPGIGPLEIMVVLSIALLIFGPKRLPELGRSIGGGLREFKQTVRRIGSDETPAGELAIEAETGRGE